MLAMPRLRGISNRVEGGRSSNRELRAGTAGGGGGGDYWQLCSSFLPWLVGPVRPSHPPCGLDTDLPWSHPAGLAGGGSCVKLGQSTCFAIPAWVPAKGSEVERLVKGLRAW